MPRARNPRLLEQRRRRAVKNLLAGADATDVARAHGVSVTAVRRWWACFEREGWAALARARKDVELVRDGADRLAEALAELEVLVAAHGLSFAALSCPQLVELLDRVAGLGADAAQVWRALRVLGLHARGRGLLTSREDNVIGEWIERHVREMAAQYRRGDTPRLRRMLIRDGVEIGGAAPVPHPGRRVGPARASLHGIG